MTLLRDLNLPATLETSRHDLTHDFFEPLLCRAIRYDRGVGYFSSGWLRINAIGLTAFAARGGHARWITSPILAQEDWHALQQGVEARRDEVLRAVLAHAVGDLARSLEAHTLSALAWMVADNILDFRLAVPTAELTGEFHAKFGLFSDVHGNQVSFEGSYNDSIQGTRNYESIKIFCSWKAGHLELIQHDQERFERLWRDEDPNVRVLLLPDAIREQILKLRTHERPYQVAKQTAERSERYRRTHPQRPSELRLRDYQEEAIEAWFANECQGICEMATGTGKTITALAAAVKQQDPPP
ncbi:DEAD/DEAH box helicase family protein [Candidatus Viridilinea mediisalina]|nr:DEAD/DEAH box helicase family protein [Candidatus Viridilinea mediisalina]